MRASGKTAFGIDVTETRISTVLLGRTAQGFRVLDAAQIPLPEGTFEQGRVADAEALLRVLRTAKGRNRIQAERVAISLPAASTVTRVVGFEEEDPQRIAQFVRNEIKEYAALSGREVVSDFHVVVPAKYNAPGRILMTATDNHLAATVTEVCRRAQLGVGAVEPASIACMRVVAGVEPACKSLGCVLLVVLKEGVLNLCVLRRGVLEFVRAERLATAPDGLDQVRPRVAEEVNGVIRFYGRENTVTSDSWRVIILDDDNTVVADDTREFLKTDIAAGVVDVRTVLCCSEAVQIAPQFAGLASITALGLAMRFLGGDEGDLRVSLLPAEAIRAKSARRNMLLAANTLAAFMLVVVLVVGALRLTTKRVNQSITALRQTELKDGQNTLSAAVNELTYVEARSERLTADLASLRHVAESHVDLDWPQLLDDIKVAAPEVLCVTELTVNVTSDLFMEGLSQSYEAVHLFVEMLNRSEQIAQASVVETGRSSRERELVRYVVRCVLTGGKAP